MPPRSTAQGGPKSTRPDTGGTTVPPLSNIAEEHPTGEKGTGATIASSSSGDGVNQRESPPMASPTGNPSPAGSGADDPYYQVAPDEWM